MAFCTQCGKRLAEGEVCACTASSPRPSAAPSVPISFDKDAAQSFLVSMKNRMGIGEPERNASDAYEKGMKIVPDSICESENEIPVRQYNIAVLRNLLRFERSEGRLQITNKRVIFRAAGRSIGGRTTLQQEFAIDEIAGLDAIRNYRFSGFHCFVGIVTLLLTSFIGMQIVLSGVDWGWGRQPTMEILIMGILGAITGDFPGMDIGAMAVILGLILGFGGIVPFFILHRKFFLKLLFLGLSYGSFTAMALTGNALINLLFIISWLLMVFGLILYCVRPNLALQIETKGATAPIDIIRTRRFADVFQSSNMAHAGFSEVIPTPESEKAIREVGAIINDLQKLGDMGVEIWVE